MQRHLPSYLPLPLAVGGRWRRRLSGDPARCGAPMFGGGRWGGGGVRRPAAGGDDTLAYSMTRHTTLDQTCQMHVIRGVGVRETQNANWYRADIFLYVCSSANFHNLHFAMLCTADTCRSTLTHVGVGCLVIWSFGRRFGRGRLCRLIQSVIIK